MTVQIEVDEKMWAEAETLAKDLNIDFNEMLLNSLRLDLYRLKEKRAKELTVAEKERRHRESYEKFPVQPNEFEIEDKQMEEFWKQV